MRLEAKIRKGFYPLPVAVVPLICKRLVATSGATVFDPCAGEGEAIELIANGLGLPASNIYAAELDEGRGRARRVGQTKGCELHYLYYRGTMQEKAAQLMAAKIRASEALDGKFSAAGLASLSGDEEDAAMAMVRTLIRDVD